MSENGKGPALLSWLSRLSYMKDSQREGETGLFTTILSHLDLAEKDEGFRHSFFTIIDGAAATCGDRMALSVLHLGIVNRSLTLDKTNLKTFADFLIHGPWMLGQLEDAAREKVKTLNFVDEIEVYLAYPVKLKERLGLQIDVGDMLYFGCSGVKQHDLEKAARGIEGMLQETDAVANILVQRQDWIEALEKHEATAEAMEAFKQKRSARHTEMAEARDLNENDYSELKRDYEADIISLTNEILRNQR
jgi:E3 ubiquitin-protein ligase SspH2